MLALLAEQHYAEQDLSADLTADLTTEGNAEANTTVKSAGQMVTRLQEISEDRLPAGNVTIKVEWSALNYKDALAITGRGKVLRQLPLVPGIDLAGSVLHSADGRFVAGQKVVLTGCGAGEEHWGGLAQLARVQGDWLLPLPENINTRQAMLIGTAGVTAMQGLLALEQAGVSPEQGEIVVTGASGGVGSCAVALLCQAGYQVVAVSGRQTMHAYLQQLGAQKVLPRQQFTEPRLLEKQQWAGAIDCIGGETLAKILAQTRQGGCVAACGLAASASLHTSVMPFILRNVRLQGINSAFLSEAQRRLIWQRLSALLPARYYQLAAQEITLEQVQEKAQQLLDNHLHGRIIVRIPPYAG